MRTANLLHAATIAVFLVLGLVVSNIVGAAQDTLVSTSTLSGVSVIPVFHGGHGGGGGHYGGHAGGHHGGGGHHGRGFDHSGRGPYGDRGRYIRHPGGFFWSDIDVDDYACVWNGYRYKCYDIYDNDDDND